MKSNLFTFGIIFIVSVHQCIISTDHYLLPKRTQIKYNSHSAVSKSAAHVSVLSPLTRCGGYIILYYM